MTAIKERQSRRSDVFDAAAEGARVILDPVDFEGATAQFVQFEFLLRSRLICYRRSDLREYFEAIDWCSRPSVLERSHAALKLLETQILWLSARNSRNCLISAA